MLMLIAWFLLMLFFVFRWPILHRFLGTVYMYLFDTGLFLVLAAGNFARPGQPAWLSYVIGGICIYYTISSGRKYLKYDEMVREMNEQGKS